MCDVRIGLVDELASIVFVPISDCRRCCCCCCGGRTRGDVERSGSSKVKTATNAMSKMRDYVHFNPASGIRRH